MAENYGKIMLKTTTTTAPTAATTTTTTTNIQSKLMGMVKIRPFYRPDAHPVDLQSTEDIKSKVNKQ